MRPRLLFTLLALLTLLALPASAQWNVEAGLALGVQSYEHEGDDPRALIGGDLLLRRDRLGVHAAFEYFDLADGGSTIVIHPNVAWRHPLPNRFALLVGAGPTFIQTANFGSEVTWNADVELARRISRIDVFARVRTYDYEVSGFRAFASPSGPAFYLGVRHAFRD